MPARIRFSALVAAAWVFFLPLRAFANTGSGSLVLSPTHEQATAAFTATFAEPGVLGAGCPPATVNFTWDNAYALGSVPLGGPDAAGNCTASLTATPPAPDRAPGGHGVVGDDGAGNTGAATYTIDRPPSPSPTPTHLPAPSPTPKRSPSPLPAPTRATPKQPPSPNALPSPTPGELESPPPPQCASFPPIDPVPEDRLAKFDGITGEVTDDPYEGWVQLGSFGPSALLPAQIAGADHPDAVLTKAVDSASPDLHRALASRSEFDCVSVSLGPAADYHYARYVLLRARVVSIQVRAGVETVVLTYRDLYYDYRPFRDGVVGARVTGHVRPGSSRLPADDRITAVVLGTLAGLLAAGGGAVALRRTLRL